jgi:ATP-dependent helicase/nuclease subunit B
MSALPAVFTIPPELPFLDALVAGILPRVSDDPLALTRYTILLPTRRAARALAEAFLRATEGRALLLPRMVAVGDVDAEELLFSAQEETADAILEIPPALSPLRRQLDLAQLVLRFGRETGAGPHTPGQAAPLARELARFLDEAQTARADLASLADLAPERFAEHWRQVLEFLRIVTEFWPRRLAEVGALDPAERRDRVLAARIAAWRAAPPADPVIAAGLSGGIPAVTELLEAVARLPRGAVVLDGLDLDAESAAAIAADPTHPQQQLVRLLSRLEIAPEDVPPWPGAIVEHTPRRALIRAALAPAEHSDQWRDLGPIGADAIAGFRRLDCPGAQEEAETIAVLMRLCLETPGKTAALVTPDRVLARRVAAELKRWDIAIDDSAGQPLDKTPPAVFLRLVLDAASEELAPLPLLAALKHPLAAGGMAPERFRALARRLELAALRGPRPAPGIEGLREAARSPALQPLIDALDRVFAPLMTALRAPAAPLERLLAEHLACAERLAATDTESGAERLWREEAGEAAAQFTAELAEAVPSFPALAGADYPALFEALLQGPVVRPRYGRHPRLAIWGLLEARLQSADVMILGGLNEDVWPRQVETDAFLSRPMRREFGLPSPEERIGIAAHDFARALGAREVWLTRAARVEGTPTVPSRWLLRFETVLRAAGLEQKLEAASEPLRWQQALDAPGERLVVKAPEPRPPVAARPRRLSVTRIEILRRDPYSIYARAILGLRPLEAIDAPPDAADRGNFIHDALHEFTRTYRDALPEDSFEQLCALGKRSFGAALERPELRAFWWPRFERVARWYIANERARRQSTAAIDSEISGELAIPAPFAPFILAAKADRIDRLRDGGLIVVDYKTGSLPRKMDWEQGYAPQLPLEAAIAERGGFAAIGARPVVGLEYWRLSGADPPGEISPLVRDGASPRALIDAAYAGLVALIGAYDDPAMPYLAVPRAEFAPRYNDYAHLARVKEWFAAADEEE